MTQQETLSENTRVRFDLCGLIFLCSKSKHRNNLVLVGKMALLHLQLSGGCIQIERLEVEAYCDD